MASTSSLRPFRMVVALDASEYAEIVAEHAIDQAARHGSVELHFVAVVRDAAHVHAAEAALATLAMEGLENLQQSACAWTSRVHVRVARDTADEIACLVGEVDADLLVVGRFGLHPRRRRDSTADRILDLVAVPTLVVGLGEHAVDAQPQCEACVAIRRDSQGERWFCDAHVAPEGHDLTRCLPSSASLVRGGGLW